jgi:hypothetical protein
MQPYSPKTDAELSRIAKGILDNEVFSSEDVKDASDIPEVFAILKLLQQRAIAYLQTFDIRYIWTWKRDALGVKHKQYDMFPGCGLLSKDDYARLVKILYDMKLKGEQEHARNIEADHA